LTRSLVSFSRLPSSALIFYGSYKLH
jgi:hypothetical protein